MSDKRRKSEYLLSEIGGIDEGFLAEAENYRRKNPVWLKPLVACACACLLVVGALGVMMSGNFMAKGEASMDNVPENNMAPNRDVNSSVQNKNESASEVVGEMISEGRLYFHVSRREALLVDSSGILLWVYAKSDGFFDGLESGDYVKIGHGPVMESYPGQTYAESIALIEDGNIYSFTDEEWERLSWVFAEPPER